MTPAIDSGRGFSPLWRCLLLSLAFGALIGYATLWYAAPILTGDSFGYMRLATDLRQLHISEFHQRTPGYPLILLLTGSGSKPTLGLFYVSLAMHFASAFCVAKLVRYLGVNRWLSGKGAPPRNTFPRNCKESPGYSHLRQRRGVPVLAFFP